MTRGLDLWASKARLAELLLNGADRLILTDAGRDANAFGELVSDIAFDVVAQIGQSGYSYRSVGCVAG